MAVTESVAIRAATVADIPVLGRHCAAMYRDMGVLPDAQFEPLRAAAEAFLAREVSTGPHGLVCNVFTEPAWRRRGLGRRLTEAAIAGARERGVTHLFLHASDQGRPLYEELGFVPTNEMRYGGPLRPGPPSTPLSRVMRAHPAAPSAHARG